MRNALIIGVFAFALSGCASVMSSAASGLSDSVSDSILNQDDPETAKAALPTFMVLIDGFIRDNPNDPDILVSGATLYASYGAIFADDEVRASRLTTRARGYALKAMCESYSPACDWPDANYDEFVATLDGIGPKQSEYLYTYGFASVVFLRAHSSDWNSLAELPQIEALFSRYLDISGDEVNSAVYTYMGVLLTLRPPALGGEPEKAREYFEKAIALTDGRDLSAKVEYARGYARLLYERELHDQLLNEVMAADPYQDGYTLSNVLAKEQAATLLADADDYF
ncbi:MAG: hypothetical protein GWP62_12885 [Gammaproteobacteria bacterium]|jgi:hypothetical protein|nr:hypothetical protein [Gammaproteobacteria bacterium]